MVDLYKKLSKERKELQEQGEVPEWFTTAGWQLFKEKYQYQGQTVKGTFERIAKCAAKHVEKHGLNVEEWEDKFFQLLWKGWLSPSTPVFSNMGTNKGMPVSCSGQYVGDSVYEFYDSYKETAILTKNGFGTSGYLSDIRPRGSKISAGGKASGIKQVFKHFVQDMRDITQGTQRRGAFAGYLDIEHKDFDEIADLIQHEPDDLNVGWIIKDKFIKKLQNGDDEANRRYKKAMKTKMLTGKGYFFFVDKVNRHRPKMYKDHKLDVKASNLCLRGNTNITIINKGIIETVSIKEFVEKFNTYENVMVKTYNDGQICYKPVSNAGITGTSNELIRIETESGNIIECTENHLIYTQNRGWVEAGKLLDEDNLVSINNNEKCITSRLIIPTEPVYDITVPDTECFYANNVLVHNCAEITLHSSEDLTYTCVLSAMNLAWYDDWKDTDAVFNATVFLDCVAEEFIDQASDIRGLEKAVNFTKKGRALGLGVCGFHTYLQEKRWPFEGMEAHLWNTQVFKNIRNEADKASKWMAETMGEPEWCKGYGLRNTHLLACMPTKSTAILQSGVSEGINPDPAYVFTQSTAAGEMDRIAPAFLKLLKEKDKYNKETIKSITEKNGSVQHLDWLTPEEKLVFRTAFEIDQSAQLRLSASRQKFVDQGQSINLFFSADEDEKRITQIHQQAFLDENVHSLYYIYTLAGVQAAKSECIACQ